MTDELEYLRINRANWDDRARLHVQSPDYAVEKFDDPDHLSSVVAFDRPLLGDISGLRGVHLQCHIGTDTVSLARLGASMVGVDLSPESVRQARIVEQRARSARPDQTGIHWVVCDVYQAASAIEAQLPDDHAPEFDLVYTGIGALCWLPDIKRWAETVATLLRPGGRLYLREAHPVLWSLDDPRPDGLLTLEYPYFEQLEPATFDESWSYVGTAQPLAETVSQQWNHGLGEVLSACLAAGLRLTMIEEHATVDYPALGDQMEELANGQFRLRDRPARLPVAYTLQAIKE